MNDYVQKLEEIADKHICPSEAHLVDSKILTLDMLKLIPYIIGPKVLELGYGDGMWTPKMIELFGESHVVDASEKLLNQVKGMYGNKVNVYPSLFEQFTPPFLFNTIIATHVLEHVDDPVAVLRRCATWLVKSNHDPVKNGVIVIVVPNATSLHRQLAVRMGIQQTLYDFSPRDYEVGHQRVYDLPQLRADVEMAGYEIIYERGLFLKILPNGMMTHFSDDLIKALVDISDDLPTEYMANIALVIRPSPNFCTR